MSHALEQFMVRVWNQLAKRQRTSLPMVGLFLGRLVVEEQVTPRRLVIPEDVRRQHVVVWGQTGFGKTSLFRHLIGQDIEAGHGVLIIDFHGDLMPYALSLLANMERHTGRDLSERVIIIDPSNPTHSVGVNPLQGRREHRFRQISEVAALLERRYDVKTYGARTEELLRSTAYVLAEANLTLADARLLLTNPAFRTLALSKVHNSEVRAYFEQRFSHAREQKQVAMCEPILSRLAPFLANPHYRDVFGQVQSTFSMQQAMDTGRIVLARLDKGLLGPEALTFAGLILSWTKSDLFSRANRRIFAAYLDEVQNLTGSSDDLQTLLSESRKFGLALTTACQFLDQHPTEVRAALLSAANYVLFRLSPTDADKFASALDGGKQLAGLLRHLPPRHIMAKTGNERFQHAVVPYVDSTVADFSDLYRRSMERWARRRTDIEAEIEQRQAAATAGTDEVLHGWD